MHNEKINVHNEASRNLITPCEHDGSQNYQLIFTPSVDYQLQQSTFYHNVLLILLDCLLNTIYFVIVALPSYYRMFALVVACIIFASLYVYKPKLNRYTYIYVLSFLFLHARQRFCSCFSLGTTYPLIRCGYIAGSKRGIYFRFCHCWRWCVVQESVRVVFRESVQGMFRKSVYIPVLLGK